MESLKELISIITKYKVRSINIIGTETKDVDKNSRVEEFYQGVLSKKFQSDEAAANYFFDADQKNPNYRKLKNSLKRRLIDSAFFIDVNIPSFNESQKAYYECYKAWAAINILLGREAKKTAIEIAEKILKKAIKYEFTVLLVDITKTLRDHYAGQFGNKKKYELYKGLLKESRKNWFAEMQAESFYTELITNYVHSITAKPYIFEVADQYLQELAPYQAASKTYRLHMFAYLIEVIKFTSVNDYRSMSETCERAIAFFESKTYLAKSPLSLFLHQKIVCHIQLKEYQKGTATANRSLELMSEGTYKWFKQLELNIILAFHTKRYKEAYRVFEMATKHKSFKLQMGTHQEVWKIYEAYIFYLISINQITFSEEEKKEVKRFRVAKFLNEVPTYSKDKRGMNIPVLVVHILFLIQNKRYDAAVDRIETIEKYCSRHLQKDENYRSNYFIKMLIQIPKASFQKSKVLTKAKRYVQKLHELPLENAAQSFEIEIVPYEFLWDYMIESLDDHLH